MVFTQSQIQIALHVTGYVHIQEDDCIIRLNIYQMRNVPLKYPFITISGFFNSRKPCDLLLKYAKKVPGIHLL